jgi:hypothetical protein
MIFYHGTSEENWKIIQTEGVLWGVRSVPGLNPSRCTYLAVNETEARQYGTVILEVEYDPLDRHDEQGRLNNWFPRCWQLRVYEPILLKNICKKN